jgi:hypothetical protein
VSRVSASASSLTKFFHRLSGCLWCALPNDLSNLKCVHAISRAYSEDDATACSSEYKKASMKVPLIKALLRLDARAPSFPERIALHAQAGPFILQDMRSNRVWTSSNKLISFLILLLLVGYTWPSLYSFFMIKALISRCDVGKVVPGGRIFFTP